MWLIDSYPKSNTTTPYTTKSVNPHPFPHSQPHQPQHQHTPLHNITQLYIGVAVANASFRTLAVGEMEDQAPDFKALESLIVQV